MDAKRLLEAATRAREHAYAPYSRYAVGAAVLAAGGRIHTGANVENASSGLTVCAERVAIWKAVSEGDRALEALAVVTGNRAAPCGACRQVLHEFAPRARILLGGVDGTVQELELQDLLPRPFGPDDLGA
jgi:cytidine deaminase